MKLMDLQNKNKSKGVGDPTKNIDKDSGSIFGKPEQIFEDVVGKKYPSLRSEIPKEIKPEEVSEDVQSASEVERPAPEVLNTVPAYSSSDSHNKYFFVAAIVVFFAVLVTFLYFIFMRKDDGAAQVASVPVTITYWGLWEDENILRPVFDAYTKKNPHVTITYDKRTPKDYIALLLGRSPNGKGPDIFRYHNTWIPELTGGILASIPQEIMSKDEYEKTFYKVQQDDLGISGKYYGIPLYIDGLVLIYNTDILKAGGVQSPPTSFVGDLVDIATSVTVKGEAGPVTSGIALGTSNNIEHFSDIFGVIMLLDNLEKQEDVSNAWAKAVFYKMLTDGSQSERGGEDLRIFREFAEQGIWSENMPNSIEAFASGKVAMIFAPTWQIPVIKAKNPDLKFAVAPVPQGLEGKHLTMASYWVEGVSSYSKAQIESWKLLKFMSQAENQEKMFALQSQYRGMGMAYSRVDMKSKLVDHPELGPLLLYSDSMVSLPIISRTYDAGLNDETSEYISKAISDSAKGVSYSSAFQQATTGIRQVMETKYKINLNSQ